MTLTLSGAQALGLVEAVTHAERIGLPMNRLVTVHWGALGLSDDEALAATGRLLKLWREALAAGGLSFACAWVRENDNGDASKGAHTHIMAHVPAAAGKGFMRRLRAWARLAAGGRYSRRRGCIEGRAYIAGAVLTERIGGRLGLSGPVHLRNLAATTAYVLKGAELVTVEAALAHPMMSGVPLQCLYRHGRIRHGEGGRIIGKRCGWTENIGATARRRAGES